MAVIGGFGVLSGLPRNIERHLVNKRIESVENWLTATVKGENYWISQAIQGKA